MMLILTLLHMRLTGSRRLMSSPSSRRRRQLKITIWSWDLNRNRQCSCAILMCLRGHRRSLIGKQASALGRLMLLSLQIFNLKRKWKVRVKLRKNKLKKNSQNRKRGIDLPISWRVSPTHSMIYRWRKEYRRTSMKRCISQCLCLLIWINEH